MLRNDQADADRQPDAVRQTGLLDYLLESDLAGMQHLRPYLKKLLAQGRLLLLCDGLDEVDAHYRAAVSAELAELLLMTQNRFVITCLEADYLEQQDVVKLVDEGHIEQALMRPLQLEQVREFIEQYIEDQPGGWQHTAGQIMQLIEYSRLRYLCTNPFMLFRLLEGTPSQFTYDLTALVNILDFAQDAGLIELSSQGILSFRHALFADYWTAEYFLNNATNEQTSSPSPASDFLARIEDWSNIIALWVGLVDNPMQLAEWFIKMGRVHANSGTLATGKIPVAVSSLSFLQMVTLSLICMRVTWSPHQADVQREMVLPASLPTMLTT